jgi:hypothetical protein
MIGWLYNSAQSGWRSSCSQCLIERLPYGQMALLLTAADGAEE